MFGMGECFGQVNVDSFGLLMMTDDDYDNNGHDGCGCNDGDYDGDDGCSCDDGDYDGDDIWGS